MTCIIVDRCEADNQTLRLSRLLRGASCRVSAATNTCMAVFDIDSYHLYRLLPVILPWVEWNVDRKVQDDSTIAERK